MGAFRQILYLSSFFFLLLNPVNIDTDCSPISTFGFSVYLESEFSSTFLYIPLLEVYKEKEILDFVLYNFLR